ncbi:MAG: hypothetical protein V1674_00235 [Candidatus Omnitrophota bacterium]
MKKTLVFCLVLFFTSLGCQIKENNAQVNSLKTETLSEANIGAWSETVDGLRSRIATDKKIYYVGDQIIFSLTWENLNNKEVLINFREDRLLQGMMSFKNQGGRGLLSRLITLEFAPVYQKKIPSHGLYSYELVGKFTRKTPDDVNRLFVLGSIPEDIENFYGNIVLEFSTKTLSEIPVLIGKSGKFFVSLNYEMSPDSYFAKKESLAWTGRIESREVMFEVRGK